MKLFAIISFCVSLGMCAIQTLPATPANVNIFSQIVDIRIDIERQETGIIKDAKLIKFNKDKKNLIRDINLQIDTSKPFAIICRSGRKSAFVAELIDAPDLNITILDGGMKKLINHGYITAPYKD